ncbi:MAG: alpha/beta fold hydrolase [Bradymonadaceae bacterium]|nr:alpha/beta fold hydrolase [Lujinxingiaceae bacterium]
MTIFKSVEEKAKLIAWFERFRERLNVPTRSQFVETSFGTTHIMVGGPEHAENLVILHGQLATSAHALVELAPLLERFRVYAVDIVGQSVMGHDELLSVSNNDYGHWLKEVLDGLGLTRVHVLGVSFGGFVAMRLAAVAPERIERLVLLVPAGVVKSHWSGWYKIGIPMTLYLMSPTQKRLEAFLANLLTTPEDQEWVGYMGDVFRSVNLARMKIPRLAKLGEFAAMEAPILVLGADQDLSFPGEQLIARLGELFTSVQDTELIKDCRHCPPTNDDFRGWLGARISNFLLAN